MPHVAVACADLTPPLTAIVAIEPAEPWIWASVAMSLLLLAPGLLERAGERS